MPTFLAWLGSVASVVLSKVVPSVVILLVGYLAIHLAMNLLGKALQKSKLEKAAHSLVTSVAKVVLWALLALMVASKLGIDVTGIIALASVLTLAVSLALQGVLGNVTGGFVLLSTKPFKTGDYVDVAGQSGTIQEIGIAYTKLLTPDNKVVSIPNSAVVAAEVVNYTAAGTRRVDFAVSAAYSAPVQLVLDSLKEAAEIPTVLQDPAVFTAVNRYGDSAIEYVLRVWCKSDDYWDTTFQINQRIKECFDHSGIEMTYPHLNVHLDK